MCIRRSILRNPGSGNQEILCSLCAVDAEPCRQNVSVYQMLCAHIAYCSRVLVCVCVSSVHNANVTRRHYPNRKMSRLRYICSQYADIIEIVDRNEPFSLGFFGSLLFHMHRIHCQLCVTFEVAVTTKSRTTYGMHFAILWSTTIPYAQICA